MKNSKLTDKDLKLIEEAENLSSIEWGIAYSLADKADTFEAKQKLKEIGVRKYRNEEYACGCN